MGKIKIGLVTGLETKDPVTEDFLTLLNDVQTPVCRIKEWDALGWGVRDTEAKSTGCEAYRGTNRRSPVR